MPPFIPDQADEDRANYGLPFPGFGAADDFDEPVNVVSDLLSDPEVDPTVVALPEVPEDDYQQEQAREPEAPAVAVAAVQFDLHMEQRVVNGPLYREQVGEDNELEEDAYYSQDDSPDSPPHAPVADMELDDGELAGDELPEPALAEPVSVKKRGRPSLSAGKTPTKSTPASKNGTAERSTASRSAGRKRKAEESDEADEADEEPAAEATPARKRGRPAAPKTGAASAASARLAAKATKAPKRGRPAVTSSSTKSDTDGAKRGPGRPKAAAKATTSAKKSTKQAKEEEVPEGEYEVEEILDSAIDADSLEHLYHVKWKGYSVDEATWEPKTNLTHASELIRAFDAKKNKRTRAPNGTAASKPPEATEKAASAKRAAAATAPAKKAGRPPGRPRKSAAPAPAVAAVSKSKEVKKPGKPGRPSKAMVAKKGPGRPPAAAGARRSARSRN